VTQHLHDVVPAVELRGDCLSFGYRHANPEGEAIR
jgi:hypothetical protein